MITIVIGYKRPRRLILAFEPGFFCLPKMPGGDAGRRTHDGDITRSCRFKAAPPGGWESPPPPLFASSSSCARPGTDCWQRHRETECRSEIGPKKASGSGIDPSDSTLIRRSPRSGLRRNRESSVIWVKPWVTANCFVSVAHFYLA